MFSFVHFPFRARAVQIQVFVAQWRVSVQVGGKLVDCQAIVIRGVRPWGIVTKAFSYTYSFESTQGSFLHRFFVVFGGVDSVPLKCRRYVAFHRLKWVRGHGSSVVFVSGTTQSFIIHSFTGGAVYRELSLFLSVVCFVL